MLRGLIVWGFLVSPFVNAQTSDSTSSPARVASLVSSDLADFENSPPSVRLLLEACLALTHQNLGYQFGSSDPTNGGMDCSGTIYYVLQSVGLKEVPRSASDQYVWARKAGTFRSVISRKMTTFELDALQPGDLLFWTGTYATPNDPPVTHSMIYLGKRRSDHKSVMFGASDGRTYDNQKMSGVSVFDFKISRAKPNRETGKLENPGSNFIGYARLPQLNSIHSSSP